MSFSGASSRFRTDMSYVGVFRNEILEFLFYDTDQAAGAAGKSIAYTWMMDLVKDDELTLYSFNILASGANPNKIEGPITFTLLIELQNYLPKNELKYTQNWFFKLSVLVIDRTRTFEFFQTELKLEL